jgi:hypothetical protein
MAVFKKGLQANKKEPLLDRFLSKHEIISVGRVKDIILNDQYPEIEKFGGLNAIGTIFFEINNFQSGGEGIAKPFYPQTSSYPLVNEIVLIFKLPSTNIGKNTLESTYYYMNMVSLWNHPHHNAYPNPVTTSDLPPSQQKDYEQTSAGSVRRVTDQSTEINLNSPSNPSQNTFVERNNIHPLLPYAGDIIHEGRWGNSIRFGSTARPFNSASLNPWSRFGNNGNPITLIRNGQPISSSNAGWEPIVEDINKDQSSIYLTSNQQILINVASQKYFSYTPREKEIPISPSRYTGDQVIINSGRLLFNSNSDHILLSSQRTISFEALKGFNFDTPSNFVIDVGTTIKLGNKDATESVVKGDTLYKNLNNLLISLLQIVQVLKYQQLWPAGSPAADPSISLAASSTEDILKNIQKDLKNILSKTVKTI